MRHIKRTDKLLVLIVALVVIILFFLAVRTISNHSKKIEYKEGPGGSTALVVSYRDQAVKAWKQGDRKNAKKLAEKGTLEYQKLTNKQQAQVPKQSSLLLNLYDLTHGLYDDEQ